MGVLVKQFEAANPDIEVRMQLIPWGTYYDKLTLSMAYGGTPDVFIMQAARFPEFASFHTIRPAHRPVRERQVRRLTAKDFATGSVPRRVSIEGTQYALPLDMHPDRAVLQHETVSRGRNRGRARQCKAADDARRVYRGCPQKLTRDTTGAGGRPDQWGFVITNQHSNWLTFADQFGGGIVSPDGKHGAMSSPGSLAATQFLCDLIYKYRVCPQARGRRCVARLPDGKSGDGDGGHLHGDRRSKSSKGLDFAGAPIPHSSARKQGVWARNTSAVRACGHFARAGARRDGVLCASCPITA